MIARRALARLLAGIEGGRIEIADRAGARRLLFGPPDAGLRATVDVRDPAAYRSVLRGSTGLADAYVDGAWEADDLVALLRIAVRNLGPLDRLRARWAPLLAPLQRAAARLAPRNDLPGARRNVAAHYDLGNELFALFLDESLSYSCACFERAGATLAQAQTAKLERICRALELREGERLLEIGGGWGALAIHAAREHGALVTTTTISRAQRELAVERVRAAGLADSVTVLAADYRELDGRYDKLVSVEMIEAVGWQYLDAFFRSCSRLLAPDGLMALQAITIDDALYEAEKGSRSFANTRVFPGGCLPSQAAIRASLARATDMRPVRLHDITEHYVTTLRHWRAAFERNRGQLAALGYGERFRRLWRLYLSYVEAGFAERRIGDVQLLAAKPSWRAGRMAGRCDASSASVGRPSGPASGSRSAAS